MEKQIEEVAKIIKKSSHAIAFTGAGISVESGIPPFRGENGLWNKYNPEVLDLNYFYENTERSWEFIREIFYDFFTDTKPNKAHYVLARMEKEGILKSIITQNIDNLHQEAGSKTVYEFHGNSKTLVCMECGKRYKASSFDLRNIPPRCPADGAPLKPDFIFFGEGIPPDAYKNSFAEAEKADVCIIIGSTGEIMPASYVPQTAKETGAFIIEINPDETNYTRQITDIHLKGKAGEVLAKLEKYMFE